LITAKIANPAEQEEIKETWRWAITNPDVKARTVDKASFNAFLDYLKIIQVAKFVPEFGSKYNKGEIVKASSDLKDLLNKIKKISEDSNSYALEPDKILEKISKRKKEAMVKYFYSGCKALDNAVNGFAQQ